MARARNIKPGFFKNEDLAECSVWARLLFPGLWTLADREGRIEDRPKRIKGEIFPFDSVEVDPLLVELVQWGFVTRYVADGKRCIQIKKFNLHQSPHGTEKDSELPDEAGVYTVNERVKSHITGKTSQNKGVDTPLTVNPPLDNGATTVNPPLHNALNPESCILNPDSLNPSSLNPESEDTLNVNPAPDPIEAPLCVSPTPGEVCKAIKAEGISAVNPQHPVFLALLADGVTLDAFTESAKLAHKKGKGFAYLLGIVKGQLEDAKTACQTGDERPGCRPIPGNAPRSQPESFKQQDDRIARQRWEQQTGRKHPENAGARTVSATVIDITPYTPKPLELAQ